MSHARFEAACATLLAGTMGGDDGTGAIGTAEIFDPSTKTWKVTGWSMRRLGNTAGRQPCNDTPL